MNKSNLTKITEAHTKPGFLRVVWILLEARLTQLLPWQMVLSPAVGVSPRRSSWSWVAWQLVQSQHCMGIHHLKYQKWWINHQNCGSTPNLGYIHFRHTCEHARVYIRVYVYIRITINWYIPELYIWWLHNDTCKCVCVYVQVRFKLFFVHSNGTEVDERKDSHGGLGRALEVFKSFGPTAEGGTWTSATRMWGPQPHVSL